MENITFFKINPQYAFGGENYPHFRNETDKDNYVKTMLSSETITKNVSYENFSVAKITVLLSEIEINIYNCNHLKVQDTTKVKYYGITHYQFNSEDVPSVELTIELDFWLTYWPLKTLPNSKCYVEKMHTERLIKDKNDVIEGNKDPNKSLNGVDEDLKYPATIVTKNLFPDVGGEYSNFYVFQMTYGNIIEGKPDTGGKTYPLTITDNFLSLTPQFYIFVPVEKINSSGIFKQLTGDFKGIGPTINIGDELYDNPYLTNVSLISIPTNDVNLKKYPGNNGPSPVVLPTPDDMSVVKLNLITISLPPNPSKPSDIDVFVGYSQLQRFFVTACSAIANTFNDRIPYDSYSGVNGKSEGASLPESFGSFEGTSDSITVHTNDNCYFIHGDFFTAYMNYSQGMIIDFGNPFKPYTEEPQKTDKGLGIQNEVKYYIKYTKIQTHFGNSPPHYGEWAYLEGIHTFNYLININPTEIVYQITPIKYFINNQDFRFNQQLVNPFGINSASNSEKTFGNQHQSIYKTSLSQANLSVEQAKGGIGAGVVSDVAKLGLATVGGSFMALSKGASGVMGAGVAGAGVGSGIIGGIGNSIFKEKQAQLALQQVKNQIIDLTRQPDHINSNTTIGAQYNINYNINNLLPKISVGEPIGEYKNIIANEFNRNGYTIQLFMNVDFKVPIRYYFNYYKISLIETLLDKSNINVKVVDWFNTLFSGGARLWNVYNDIEINNYEYENWENALLPPPDKQIAEELKNAFVYKSTTSFVDKVINWNNKLINGSIKNGYTFTGNTDPTRGWFANNPQLKIVFNKYNMDYTQFSCNKLIQYNIGAVIINNVQVKGKTYDVGIPTGMTGGED